MAKKTPKHSSLYLSCGEKGPTIGFASDMSYELQAFIREYTGESPKRSDRERYHGGSYARDFEARAMPYLDEGPCTDCVAYAEAQDAERKSRNARRARIKELGLTNDQILGIHRCCNNGGYTDVPALAKEVGITEEELKSFYSVVDRTEHMREIDLTPIVAKAERCHHRTYSFSVTERGRFYISKKDPNSCETEDKPARRVIPGPHWNWMRRAIKQPIVL